MYPPVGPINAPNPPLKPLKTGRPISPNKIYKTWLNTANLGFNSAPHKKTPTTESEKTIGLKGSIIFKSEKITLIAQNNAVTDISFIFNLKNSFNKNTVKILYCFY